MLPCIRAEELRRAHMDYLNNVTNAEREKQREAERQAQEDRRKRTEVHSSSLHFCQQPSEQPCLPHLNQLILLVEHIGSRDNYT